MFNGTYAVGKIAILGRIVIFMGVLYFMGDFNILKIYTIKCIHFMN